MQAINGRLYGEDSFSSLTAVSESQESMPRAKWNHIPSQQNPADLSSHEMEVKISYHQTSKLMKINGQSNRCFQELRQKNDRRNLI